MHTWYVRDDLLSLLMFYLNSRFSRVVTKSEVHDLETNLSPIYNIEHIEAHLVGTLFVGLVSNILTQ